MAELPTPLSHNDEPAVTPRRLRTDTGPRGLVLAWCLWLLGSWAVTLRIDSSGPAVRWMMFAAVTGLMLLWPAFRLSQDYPVPQGARHGDEGDSPLPAAMPLGRIWLDWLSLNIVFQAVLWPLQVTARWWLVQALLLDAAIASWSLLTAVLIGVGCRSRRGGQRAVAMVLCVLLLLGEPLLLGLADYVNPNLDLAAWQMRVSPIQTIWVLTGSPQDFLAASAGGWIGRVASVAVAAGIGWLWLLLINSRGKIKRPL